MLVDLKEILRGMGKELIVEDGYVWVKDDLAALTDKEELADDILYDTGATVVVVDKDESDLYNIGKFLNVTMPQDLFME